MKYTPTTQKTWLKNMAEAWSKTNWKIWKPFRVAVPYSTNTLLVKKKTAKHIPYKRPTKIKQKFPWHRHCHFVEHPPGAFYIFPQAFQAWLSGHHPAVAGHGQRMTPSSRGGSEMTLVFTFPGGTYRATEAQVWLQWRLGCLEAPYQGRLFKQLKKNEMKWTTLQFELQENDMPTESDV